MKKWQPANKQRRRWSVLDGNPFHFCVSKFHRRQIQAIQRQLASIRRNPTILSTEHGASKDSTVFLNKVMKRFH